MAAEQGDYKIAVTTDEENNVFGHFGHCERFTLYSMSDGILMAKTALNTDGNGHEAMVQVLVENNVKVLICGGIGRGAMEALLAAGITVIPGMTGDIDVAVAGFLDGSLKESAEPNCSTHDSGDCSCDGGCGGCCH